MSFPGVAEAIHSSDLVLNLGPLLSDSNTGSFTREIKDENVVLLGHAFCQVKSKKSDGVHFLPVLKRIVEELKKDTKGYQLPRLSRAAKPEVSYIPLSKPSRILAKFVGTHPEQSDFGSY